MKAILFSILLHVASSFATWAASSETQLIPENIEKQDYGFKIEAKKGGNTVFFTISIEAKPNAYWTHFLETTLMMNSDGKQIMQCDLQATRQEKRLVVSEFSVASDYLATTQFRFGVMAESNGQPMPAGLFFWFTLKDFAKPK